MRLSDVGGRAILMRVDRVWFACLAGRCGWGLTADAALKSAMRGAYS